MSDDDLTLLYEADEQHELALIRSLLDAQGISYVVQGEHHSAMVTGMLGAPVIKPRVLVSNRDLQRAREVLEASPIAEPPEPGVAGVLPEGAVCPVHEKPAVVACTRCGTFLCAECKVPAGAPVCEDCGKADDKELGDVSAKIRDRRRTMVMLVLGVFALFMLLPWLRQLF